MSYRDSQRFRKVYGYYRTRPRGEDTSILAAQEYIDGALAGFDWKQSVRVASTMNVSTTSPGVIDGITLVDEDRVLLKDQTSGVENGIYMYYTATDSLVRAKDGEQDTLTCGATTYVEEGTTNIGTIWLLSTNDPITVGTTSQTWDPFPSTGGGTVAGSITQVQYNNGGSFGASSNFTFNSSTNNLVLTGSFVMKGDITPDADVAYNLGSSVKRWANIYTGDLHLKNERGDYTLIEEEDFLSIRFNRTGQRYKFVLERVPELDDSIEGTDK